MKNAVCVSILAATVLAGTNAGAFAQTTAGAPPAPPLIAPRAAAFHFDSSDAAPPGVAHAQWAGAWGSWNTATEDGMLQAHASFRNLVPSGHYSLFVVHAANGVTKIGPVDQSGSTDTFVASPGGKIVATTTISQPFVAGDEVILVYRTATPANPKKIGRLGRDAFVQLRLRQP